MKPLHVVYDEMGGYDCMTPAFQVCDADKVAYACLDFAAYKRAAGREANEAEIAEARRYATLFAAAPDLLVALTALLAKHDDRDGASDLWPKEAAQARAAIAKAQGEKP